MPLITIFMASQKAVQQSGKLRALAERIYDHADEARLSFKYHTSAVQREKVRTLLETARHGSGVSALKALQAFAQETPYAIQRKLGMDWHERTTLTARLSKEAGETLYAAALGSKDPMDALVLAGEASLALFANTAGDDGALRRKVGKLMAEADKKAGNPASVPTLH